MKKLMSSFMLIFITTVMASVVNLPSEIDQGKGDEQPPELFKKSEMTDITLIVEGKKLHFVKFLLMEGSSVFAQMTKNSTDPSQLTLADLTYTDMIMFLECLHPKCFLEISDTNLEPVTTVARKFEYERILRICEQYIIQKFNVVMTTTDRMYPHFFFHLKVADKCGLEKAIEVGVSSKQVELAFFSMKLRNVGWKATSNNIIAKGYENDINFSELSLETKFKIISRRLKETEKRIPVDNPY